VPCVSSLVPVGPLIAHLEGPFAGLLGQRRCRDWRGPCVEATVGGVGLGLAAAAGGVRNQGGIRWCERWSEFDKQRGGEVGTDLHSTAFPKQKPPFGTSPFRWSLHIDCSKSCAWVETQQLQNPSHRPPLQLFPFVTQAHQKSS
jgi:hypothetical protein